MDETQLIRAVLAEPDHDGARLVYADWLSQQGDPRAEYLRLEVSWGRLALGDRRATRMQTRLRELQSSSQPFWRALVGKQYDVVLQSYPVGRRGAVVAALQRLLHRQRSSIESIVDGMPWPLVRGLPRDEAEVLQGQLLMEARATTSVNVSQSQRALIRPEWYGRPQMTFDPCLVLPTGSLLDTLMEAAELVGRSLPTGTNRPLTNPMPIFSRPQSLESAVSWSLKVQRRVGCPVVVRPSPEDEAHQARTLGQLVLEAEEVRPRQPDWFDLPQVRGVLLGPAPALGERLAILADGFFAHARCRAMRPGESSQSCSERPGEPIEWNAGEEIWLSLSNLWIRGKGTSLPATVQIYRAESLWPVGDQYRPQPPLPNPQRRRWWQFWG